MDSFNSVLSKMIGQKIKAKREQIGFNQTELSLKVEIGRSSISNIEKGKQLPPISLLYQICYHLEIDIQSLLPIYSDILEELNKTDPSLNIEMLLKEQGASDSTISVVNDFYKSIEL